MDEPVFNGDALDIARAFGVLFSRSGNANVFCPFHENPSSSDTKSCSVSAAGLFHCHACGAKGTAHQFYARVRGISEADALSELSKPADPSTMLRSTVSTAGPLFSGVGVPKNATCMINPRTPSICYRELLRDAAVLKYLTEVRGLTPDTLRTYEIGVDEYRITIPIYDEVGALRDIRRYDRNSRISGAPKMVYHMQGLRLPSLYGWDTLQKLSPGDEVIVCEGEWDRLILEQHGFAAVTHTGGVTYWDVEWTSHLRLYRVVFLFDVHDKVDPATGLNNLGQRMAHRWAREVKEAGAPSVRVAELPLPKEYVGGDATDWFVKAHRTAEELRKVIDATPEWDPSQVPADVTVKPAVNTVDTNTQMAPPMTQKDTVPWVTLTDAADAQHYYKPIRMRCIVAGRASPYLAPKLMKVEESIGDGQKKIHEVAYGPWDSITLSLIRCSKASQKLIIRTNLGIPKEHAVLIEVVESMNIEEVFLIPTIDKDQDQGPYTMRRAYYIGRGLETNRVYDFKGYTLPDPITQAVTHILVEATPAETDIDSFKLVPEEYEKLKSTFQTDDIYTKMDDIAKQLSEHVTSIRGRIDLHIVVDLVFHSPLMFAFDGQMIRKGWLEALILGDTRTGKGYVTEGYARHYGVGEVVSGENLTLAGIVGGVQHVGDRWTLVWGKIPLADRRLIILDECGSLSHSDIGRLSRIRSEGVAELTKIISEKTTARTRLIWIANPVAPPGAPPRVISDYNYGIESVVDVIGAAEDVARFDLCLIAAKNEVPSEIINTAHVATSPLVYTADLCRALVMWAWSRKPEQIIFEEDVTPFVLKASRALGKLFSGRICLIQSEDVRYKLVRIAAAAAARVFSTPDGVHLVVKKEHVHFAYNLLHHIYSKNACGYLQMSQYEQERSALRDPKAVKDALLMCGEDALMDLIDGLLEHRLITLKDLRDYADIDVVLAQTIITHLVRERAIVKDHNGYVKRPAFKAFLHKLKMASFTDATHHTQENTDESDASLSNDRPVSASGDTVRETLASSGDEPSGETDRVGDDNGGVP